MSTNYKTFTPESPTVVLAGHSHQEFQQIYVPINHAIGEIRVLRILPRCDLKPVLDTKLPVQCVLSKTTMNKAGEPFVYVKIASTKANTTDTVFINGVEHQVSSNVVSYLRNMHHGSSKLHKLPLYIHEICSSKDECQPDQQTADLIIPNAKAHVTWFGDSDDHIRHAIHWAGHLMTSNYYKNPDKMTENMNDPIKGIMVSPPVSKQGLKNLHMCDPSLPLAGQKELAYLVRYGNQWLRNSDAEQIKKYGFNDKTEQWLWEALYKMVTDPSFTSKSIFPQVKFPGQSIIQSRNYWCTRAAFERVLSLLSVVKPGQAAPALNFTLSAESYMVLEEKLDEISTCLGPSDPYKSPFPTPTKSMQSTQASETPIRKSSQIPRQL